MRPSNKSRSRNKSGSSNQRRGNIGNIVNRVFESAGPDGKVRGTPQQVIEKYQGLARDAQVSGDRVAAESYLQHAEHYTRLLGDAQRQTQETRQDRDDRDGGQREDGQRDDGQRDDGQRDDGQRDYGQRDNGQRDYAQRDDGQRDYGRRDDGQRDYGQRDYGQRDDGQSDDQRDDDRRERDHGQGDQGQREQGQRDQGQRDQGQRDQGQREHVARDDRREQRQQRRAASQPQPQPEPAGLTTLGGEDVRGETGPVETPESAAWSAPSDTPAAQETGRASGETELSAVNGEHREADQPAESDPEAAAPKRPRRRRTKQAAPVAEASAD